MAFVSLIEEFLLAGITLRIGTPVGLDYKEWTLLPRGRDAAGGQEEQVAGIAIAAKKVGSGDLPGRERGKLLPFRERASSSPANFPLVYPRNAGPCIWLQKLRKFDSQQKGRSNGGQICGAGHSSGSLRRLPEEFNGKARQTNA